MAADQAALKREHDEQRELDRMNAAHRRAVVADIFFGLEPPIAAAKHHEAIGFELSRIQLSAALSLKRIADALELLASKKDH